MKKDIFWHPTTTRKPEYPNKRMLVKTFGRHSEYIFGYLSHDGNWRDFETEQIIKVTHFAEINSPYQS